MKKLCTTIILVGIGFAAFASEPVKSKSLSLKKSGDGGQCFDGSTHIINLGFGFGGVTNYSAYRGSGYTYRRSPAFSLSYEQPWSEQVGPGYLGIGAYAGFQSTYSSYRYKYNNGSSYYYDNRWNHFMIAARAAYHWDELNFENAELYGGVMIGLGFQSHTYRTDDPNPNNSYYWTGRSVYPAFSVFFGGRWYFAKKVALFGELGYGISYGTIGLSFKF